MIQREYFILVYRTLSWIDRTEPSDKNTSNESLRKQFNFILQNEQIYKTNLLNVSAQTLANFSEENSSSEYTVPKSQNINNYNVGR